MVSLNPRASRALVLAGMTLLLLSACTSSGTPDGTEIGDSSSSGSARSERSSARSLGARNSSQSSVRRSSSSARAQSSSDASESSAPFFSLKRSSSSSRRSVGAAVSSAQQQAGVSNVSLKIDADREEARPGDSIFSTVTVQNTSNTTLSDFQVVYSFSPAQLTVLESDGIVAADHVRWNIEDLAPQQKRALRLRAQLLTGLRHGDTVRSTAIATVEGIVDPSTAVSDIRVIENLPATGLGDGTRPLENTRRFLSPFRNGQGSNGIPAIVWSATILMGMVLGGAAMKKYL